MALTTEQVIDLKYKVEDPFLREWSMKHGITDCVRCMWHCLKSGFGYMGEQRIDREFMKSLTAGDRAIYNGVAAWLNLY